MSQSRAARMLANLTVGGAGIAVGIAIVSTVGVAAAANGGDLRLGHTNTAATITTVSDKHGTALALKGSSSKPPLTVTSHKQVTHLNSSYVGGLSATRCNVG